VTATSAVRPAPAAEERARPLGGHGTLALAGLYYLLAAIAVTLWLWRDPASRMVAGNPNDADQMAWFFRYDATSIAHLHLPALVTNAMNAPQGVNAMWNTFMLLPGVVLSPVTLIAGPQVSMTVLMTAGFAGSALAMFFVLRRWDVSVPAAAIGGAVYGFSPAMTHSAIGHYDLQFLVLPPLIVDAVLRLVLGRVGARRGGVILGLLVTAQLFITEEILFDTAVAGAVLLGVLCIRRGALAALGGPAAVRARARTVACGIGIGFAVTLVIAGYPLWVQFFGPLPQHGSPFTIDFFKNDLSGLVVPSALMMIHTSGTAAAAGSYQGQLPEYLGYLGWPLLLALIGAAVRFWRQPVIRALAVTWAVTDVFSLGGTLLVNGHGYGAVKLPWYWVQGLPLLNAVLPDRFSLVADGAAAALLAFGVDAAVPAFAVLAVQRLPRLAAGRRPALAVMCLAALIVLPVVPRPMPVTTPTPLPPGWPAVFASLRLPPSATVLVVPVPMSTFTEPLRWQADSGSPASLVGGYFMGPAWNGRAYIDGSGTPAPGLYLDQLWKASAAALPAALTGESPANSSPTSGKYVPVKAVTPAKMRAQLAAWKVTVVVAVTTPDSALTQYLTVLLGRPVAAAGDVIAWRGPAGKAGKAGKPAAG
jgi:hypothetical protein